MGFPRKKYWSGLPFPSPGDVPDPGIEPESPVLQVDSLKLSQLGNISKSIKPYIYKHSNISHYKLESIHLNIYIYIYSEVDQMNLANYSSQILGFYFF